MHTAVVGIGPGLGSAIARRFGEAGHRLSIVARSQKSLTGAAATLRSAGSAAVGYRADAASWDEMSAAVASMTERDGPIDTLIFNVADIQPDRFVTMSSKTRLGYGERWETRGAPASVDDFIGSLRANVAAALVCTKLVASAMCDRANGSILITGGTLGLSPWIEWASLSAGKAALRSLTRSLFLELCPFHVHAALITIHDTIVPGTAYDPGMIADFYWKVANQPAEAWTAEYDFNPGQVQAADPDLAENRLS
jgi:NAD(P)-dependent dehydrogenase (short-subunit alcohol dehydrogenase family)